MEDREQLLRLFPDYGPSDQVMQIVLETRSFAWQLLFRIQGIHSSGFCQKKMSAPIESGVLQRVPFHPLTTSLLYIMQMESPIRYGLRRATLAQDKAAVQDLGPLAFAL